MCTAQCCLCGAGDLNPGARLAILAGSFMGNNGEPISDPQARLKAKRCKILYGPQGCVLFMPGGFVILDNVRFKLGLGIT